MGNFLINLEIRMGRWCVNFRIRLVVSLAVMGALFSACTQLINPAAVLGKPDFSDNPTHEAGLDSFFVRSSETSPTAYFESSDPRVTFECKIGNSDWNPCAAPLDLSTLSWLPIEPGFVGNLSVRALNPGGGQGEAVTKSFRRGSFRDGGQVNSIARDSLGNVYYGANEPDGFGERSSRIAALDSDGNFLPVFKNFNGTVLTLATQSDGSIIAGGDFTTYDSVAASRIVCLQANGSRNSLFAMGAGFNGSVTLVKVQSDDKILVLGAFAEYDGQVVPNLVRLNADGSLDATFDIGTGFDGAIEGLAPAPNGKVYVHGSFSNFRGVSVGNLVRLNADGSLDSGFDLQTGGVLHRVSTIAVVNDGFFAGGIYDSGEVLCCPDPVYKSFVKKYDWDGNLDSSFVIAIPEYEYMPSWVAQIAVQNGKVFVNHGSYPFYLERFNSDGSLDSTFASQEFRTNISTMQPFIVPGSSGEVFVLGAPGDNPFNFYYQSIKRLLTNGTKDLSFVGEEQISTLQLKAVVIHPDGRILVGGSFTRFGAPHYVAKYDRTDVLQKFLTPQTLNGGVNKILIQSDDKPVFVGFFTHVNSVPRRSVARFEVDGTLDTSFDPGAGASAGSVLSAALQSDGKLILAGAFTSFNGVTDAKRVVRLNTNGGVDMSYLHGTAPDQGFNGTVNKVILQPNGKAIFAGRFASYAGIESRYLLRLNTDGSFDPGFAFGSKITATGMGLADMILDPRGNLIVVGPITNFDGATTNGIVRILPDGTRDPTLVTGAGFDVGPAAVALQADGKILVGGNFTTYKGVAVPRMVRLFANGDIDPSLEIGTGPDVAIKFIAVNPDKSIVVSSNPLPLSTFNGESVYGSVKLSPTGKIID